MTPKQVEAERALFEVSFVERYPLKMDELADRGKGGYGHSVAYSSDWIQDRFEGWLAKAEQLQKPLAQSDKVLQNV
jgi:hypothetical protein